MLHTVLGALAGPLLVAYLLAVVGLVVGLLWQIIRARRRDWMR
jgi:hypothetical protein